MKKIYDRIVDMRGNLLTVIAENVSLGEMARIHKQNGDSTYASVLGSMEIRLPCRRLKIPAASEPTTASLS